LPSSGPGSTMAVDVTSSQEIFMSKKLLRFGISSLIILTALSATVSVLVQAQEDAIPDFGPPLRPLIKLIGFLNAPPAPMSPRPVLILALPGDEKRYTFTLTDMRIMAGPLITPEQILSEVKPYTTNFYLRAPQDVVAQISDTAPSVQLSILAEYSRADRILFVTGVEKSEEPQKQ